MRRILFLTVLALQTASAESKELLFEFDFKHGAAGWLAGFSDYSLINGDTHFLAEPRSLPREFPAAGRRRGFFMQSMNRSDDMFMFIKKALHAKDGLKPNRRYRLSFEIVFASNAQAGCIGAGGAPGEGVYLKAGASVNEPVSIMGTGLHLELNIDKGHQSQGGVDAGVAGNIVNGEPCDPENARYVRTHRTYEHDRPVSTDDRSQLWLIVGTDSAFEGLTRLYFEVVKVRLKEVE